MKESTADMAGELKKDLAFVAYIDRLKNVIRVNALFDGSREENTAEHSWHAATSALVLYRYADADVDIDRVIRMLLIHDLVEIEAGDTFAYADPAVLAQQEQLEIDAAEMIFNKISSPQGETLRTLWDEFEARVTPDAKFAKAIDRLLPIFSNIYNGAEIWKQRQVSLSQVQQNIAIIRDGSTRLADLMDQLVIQAAEEGFLVT